jgi:prepilin-type N-terminal cleavage/methylation domain-containing protein
MVQSKRKGFTLLELLIVITILAILTLVVILFVNPVEILKKSRDVQRMSDLATLKTAIALYLQDRASNNLGSTTYCSATNFSGGNEPLIRMSLAYTTAGSKQATTPSTEYHTATTTADLYHNNGLGWIPSVNFGSIAGGAPIERVPADPTNTSLATGSPGVNSLYYRYGCKTNNTFELDATLESDTYKYLGTDDRPSKDGGNAVMRFEVGTDLNILPSSAPIFTVS